MINLQILFIAIAIFVVLILPFLIFLPIKYLVIHHLEKTVRKLQTPIDQLENLTHKLSTRNARATDLVGLPIYMRYKPLEEYKEMLKDLETKYTKSYGALNWLKTHFTDSSYNDRRNRFYRWFCVPTTVVCSAVAITWFISVIALTGNEIYTYKTWNRNYEKYTTMQEPTATACIDAENLNKKRDDFLFIKKEAAEDLPTIDTKLMWKRFTASVEE